MEWEGHQSETKPGWLHPAVYLLTAACYSAELEQRAQQRAAARGRWTAWGRRAAAAWQRLMEWVGRGAGTSGSSSSSGSSSAA
jgi:hypothetical protein